jgi:hypothetical protein
MTETAQIEQLSECAAVDDLLSNGDDFDCLENISGFLVYEQFVI